MWQNHPPNWDHYKICKKKSKDFLSRKKKKKRFSSKKKKKGSKVEREEKTSASHSHLLVKDWRPERRNPTFTQNQSTNTILFWLKLRLRGKETFLVCFKKDEKLKNWALLGSN